MLNVAILLLVVAVILWAAGAIFGFPPLLIGAKACGAIGVILLLVAIVLLLIPAGGVDLHTTR